MRYRFSFALVVVLLAVSFFPGCGLFAPGQRFLKIQISLDGGSILQTGYSVSDRLEAAAMWSSLQGRSLKAVGTVKAETDDSEKAVLKGKIRIVILHADNEIASAQVDELRLVRVPGSTDQWQLAPNEVQRTRLDVETVVSFARQGFARFVGNGSLDSTLPVPCCSAASETIMPRIRNPRDSKMKVVLETERLLLRHFTEADAEALLRMESEPDVLRYVGRKPLADVDAYRNKIRSTILPYYDRPGGYGGWAIIEKVSEGFVGGCSLRPGTDTNIAAEMGIEPDAIELGYGLRKPSWGRGYATEFAQALVRRAFSELGADSLVACVAVSNLASVRVLEKAGLQRVGEPICLPGEDEASVKYGLTRVQFNHQRLESGHNPHKAFRGRE